MFVKTNTFFVLFSQSVVEFKGSLSNFTNNVNISSNSVNISAPIYSMSNLHFRSVIPKVLSLGFAANSDYYYFDPSYLTNIQSIGTVTIGSQYISDIFISPLQWNETGDMEIVGKTARSLLSSHTSTTNSVLYNISFANTEPIVSLQTNASISIPLEIKHDTLVAPVSFDVFSKNAQLGKNLTTVSHFG